MFPGRVVERTTTRKQNDVLLIEMRRSKLPAGKVPSVCHFPCGTANQLHGQLSHCIVFNRNRISRGGVDLPRSNVRTWDGLLERLHGYCCPSVCSTNARLILTIPQKPANAAKSAGVKSVFLLINTRRIFSRSIWR